MKQEEGEQRKRTLRMTILRVRPLSFGLISPGIFGMVGVLPLLFVRMGLLLRLLRMEELDFKRPGMMLLTISAGGCGALFVVR